MRISVFSYEPGAETATDIPRSCSTQQPYGRMYEVKVSADSQGMTTHELVFDDAERSPIEKNWMRFEHKGVSYYIRSLHPYIVLAEKPHVGLQVAVRTEIAPFRLASEQRLAVHGGSNPILIRGGPQPTYFLGSFHTRDVHGRYRNYLFAFQSARPFAVLGISPQLPLVATGGNLNAFVSGLLLADDTSPPLVRPRVYDSDLTPPNRPTVFVSYGAGDEESRILKVPLWQVERWLFTSAVQQPEQGRQAQSAQRLRRDFKIRDRPALQVGAKWQGTAPVSFWPSVLRETKQPAASLESSREKHQPQFAGWRVVAGVTS